MSPLSGGDESCNLKYFCHVTVIYFLGNPFTKDVRRQETQDSDIESCSAKSATASPRKRKAAWMVSSDSPSSRKRKVSHASREHGAGSSSTKRKIA